MVDSFQISVPIQSCLLEPCKPNGLKTNQVKRIRTPRTHGDSGAEIARLKRRLAASQDEVKELTQSRVKKPP